MSRCQKLGSALFMLYVWTMLWHLEAEVRNCIKTGYVPPSYSLFWKLLLAGFLIQYPDSSINLSLLQP